MDSVTSHTGENSLLNNPVAKLENYFIHFSLKSRLVSSAYMQRFREIGRAEVGTCTMFLSV